MFVTLNQSTANRSDHPPSPSSSPEQWVPKRPRILLLSYIAWDTLYTEVIQPDPVRMLGLA